MRLADNIAPTWADGAGITKGFPRPSNVPGIGGSGVIDEKAGVGGTDRPNVAVLERASSSSTGSRRLYFWRSPAGQPPWARPALLCIAGLAGLAYAWGMNGAYLEPFYGGAARSMSMSWHDFIFGAADPWGTVSVDKLPGALFVQALSLRIFGFHVWAVVLPQVVEGVLTILVLYRAVRRVGGAGAGIVAALVMAVSPIVILLDRGNIADTLLILLLVLAADATIRATQSGRLRPLVWAGVLVGFAFQAKMLQAWLVLPALFSAYLVAAPITSLLRRIGHVALSTLAVVVVSLSWMSAVSLVPQSSRPYVDGSCNDSLFTQVFSYNGFSRLGDAFGSSAGCNLPSTYLVTASRYSARHGFGTFGIAASWDRLLHGPFGHDDAWLLLPAVVAAVWLLVLQRRRPRTDPLRAAVILWSAWLVLTFGFFSGIQFLNSYYTAALIPPVAALCALGAATAWHRRRSRAVRGALAALAAATVAALRRARPGLRRPAPVDRRLDRPGRPPGRRDPALVAPRRPRLGLDRVGRPRAGRRSHAPRLGLGVGGRREREPRPVRLALRTGGRQPLQPGGRLRVPGRGRRCSRGSSPTSRRTRPPTSSRPQARPATTSWPPAASSFPWAGSPGACRRRRWRSSSGSSPRAASGG